ncbi:glycosyltransferase family 2 protein [Marinobacter mangrovi]|uniref:glycosyltransferase family 2 protein n=1 Tax=Marinobacter mangrovi TaxID=2803918 RepID=UPI001932D23B|nr:glycosyltransferase family 2 protein [Marinobacter mangrovi]
MRMKLSVVIPAYNASNTIQRTLDSVLPIVGDQCEVLIVDDGSTDALAEVLKPYVDGVTVRLIRQSNSGGPASPRNRGIAETTGDYVLFLDADDVVVTDEVQPTLQLLEQHQDVSMICGNFDVTDAQLSTRISRNIDRYATFQAVLRERAGPNAWKIPSETAVAVLLQTNFVGTSSVIARRSSLELVGAFDEKLRNLDDRDMWIRLSQAGPILYRERVFYKYRDSEGSVSKQRQLEQCSERAAVAKKVIRTAKSSRIKQLARRCRSQNQLKIGYILFHERAQSRQAFGAFCASFLDRPNVAAFKGMLKSLLPRRMYQLMVRT